MVDIEEVKLSKTERSVEARGKKLDALGQNDINIDKPYWINLLKVRSDVSNKNIPMLNIAINIYDIMIEEVRLNPDIELTDVKLLEEILNSEQINEIIVRACGIKNSNEYIENYKREVYIYYRYILTVVEESRIHNA